MEVSRRIGLMFVYAALRDQNDRPNRGPGKDRQTSEIDDLLDKYAL